MHAMSGRYTMGWWLVVGGLSIVVVYFAGAGTMRAPALAAESQPFAAQAQAFQRGDNGRAEAQTDVTRGMGKEDVRTVWGDPEEIRRIRTCFGWQEEWVYRGDPKRFGVAERILLFDEGEVLTEIK
ncbi:MAG TPA: hypothetical protein VLK82_26385 [Candidatus Tectomicrobia bacterium]|nr:hypothetical protein [Candidatus Tectomicrobia bacterium]